MRRVGNYLAMFAALASGLVGSMGVQIITGRYLSPESFSELAAISGLMAIMAVPGLSLQLNSASQPSTPGSRSADSAKIFRSRLLYSTRASALLAALIILTSPLLVKQLRIDAVGIVALLVYSLPVIFEPVFLGVLQAERKFRFIGVVSTIQTIGKVLSVIGAVLLGVNQGGIALGVATTAMLITIISVKLTRHSYVAVPRHLSSDATRTTALMLIFWVAATLDIYIARASLEPSVAGQYAAASTIAKLLVLISLTFNQVDFPTLVRSRTKGSPSLSILSVLLVAIPIYFLLDYVTQTLYGPSYQNGSAHLVVLSVLPLAISVNFIYRIVATKDSRRTILKWAVATISVHTVQISVGMIWITSLNQLILVSGTANLVFLCLTICEYRAQIAATGSNGFNE